MRTLSQMGSTSFNNKDTPDSTPRRASFKERARRLAPSLPQWLPGPGEVQPLVQSPSSSRLNSPSSTASEVSFAMPAAAPTPATAAAGSVTMTTSAVLKVLAVATCIVCLPIVGMFVFASTAVVLSPGQIDGGGGGPVGMWQASGSLTSFNPLRLWSAETTAPAATSQADPYAAAAATPAASAFDTSATNPTTSASTSDSTPLADSAAAAPAAMLSAHVTSRMLRLPVDDRNAAAAAAQHTVVIHPSAESVVTDGATFKLLFPAGTFTVPVRLEYSVVSRSTSSPPIDVSLTQYLNNYALHNVGDMVVHIEIDTAEQPQQSVTAMLFALAGSSDTAAAVAAEAAAAAPAGSGTLTTFIKRWQRILIEGSDDDVSSSRSSVDRGSETAELAAPATDEHVCLLYGTGMVSVAASSDHSIGMASVNKYHADAEAADCSTPSAAAAAAAGSRRQLRGAAAAAATPEATGTKPCQSTQEQGSLAASKGVTTTAWKFSSAEEELLLARSVGGCIPEQDFRSSGTPVAVALPTKAFRRNGHGHLALDLMVAFTKPLAEQQQEVGVAAAATTRRRS